MKKILAIVLMTAVLVCPAFAAGAAPAEPAADAQAPHYALEVIEPAAPGVNGVSAYVDSSTGDVLFTFETPALPVEEVPAEPAAPAQHYTYQYDAVLNEDGSFADFGTWVGDVDGDVVAATEANAAYFYGTAEEAAPAEEASGEPSGEPAEAPAEEAAEETPAEEAVEAVEKAVDEAAEAEAEEAVAEEAAAEEAPAEAAAPANPNYDPMTQNFGGLSATLALVIIAVGVLLMLSFNKKKQG